MGAHRRCKLAEETIDCETANVKKFSQTVEEKVTEVHLNFALITCMHPVLFIKVTPIYEAALEALSAVKLNDILEVMKYREPPAVLTPLFNAMCMLFDREERYVEFRTPL